MINELAHKAHQNAKDKGFFEKEKNIGEMLALIHSEVSEALEADRKDRYCKIHPLMLAGLADRDFGVRLYDENIAKTAFELSVKNTFEDELADIVIRVMDLAAYKGIDLENHIKAKMRYNASREKYHGKKY